MHVQSALFFRHVARGIRGIHDVFDGAAVAADLDQTDADADIEYLVLPDEAVVIDGAHHIVGDLPRFLERAAHQQQREFIAADAPGGIRIADGLFDERGDLAQHVVARGMAAGVVHHLEPIEVQIAQGMRDVSGLRRVHGFLQPPLEFSAIHQSRQGIVTGLIGHLTRQAAQFAGVVQHQHQSHDVLAVEAQRRDADFYRPLRAGVCRDQHGAPPHGHAAAGGEGLAHGISQRPAVRLVDQRRNVRKRPAHDLVESLAEQGLRGVIDVVDAAIGVYRDDALAHGIERHHGAGSRGHHRSPRFGQHFKGCEQQRRFAGAVDQEVRELHARHLRLSADELDLVALGRGLAGQPPPQIVGHQLGIFRRDEIGQGATHDLGGAQIEQRQKARVGEQDAIAMHEHRVVHGLDQALEELFAVEQPCAALFEVF